MSCSSHTQSPFIFKPIARLELLFLLSTILLGTILRFFLYKQPELAAAEFQTALAIDRHHPVALLAQEQLAR
jgi:hypothetical protein